MTLLNEITIENNEDIGHLKKKYNNTIKKAVFIILLVLLILYSYTLVMVIQNGNSYTPGKSDVIIILGHSLDQDNYPEKWLEERLQEGMELYNSGYGEYIIVTGGEGPLDNVAVGEAMKNYLIENGIDESMIITENRANNTYENFKFSKELFVTDERLKDKKDILVVTNDFHMYRSMMIAEDFFHQPTGKSTETKIQIRKLFAYLKEPLSILKYKVTSFVAG